MYAIELTYSVCTAMPDSQTNMPGPSLTSCGACCTKILNLSVLLGKQKILDGIHLHMHCGELIGLIGPNGAGKSTLLRAIIGEVPFSGTLEFIPSGKTQNRAPRIGYVPQRVAIDSLSPTSVLDLFAASLSLRPLWLGMGTHTIAQARASLASVNAEKLLHAPLGSLSGGELQRVLLALALTPVPDILLLDEPVAAVDHPGTEQFYHTLSELRRQHDLAILLVSHDLSSLVQVADRIVFLNRTVQCGGPPLDILTSDLVRNAFALIPEPENVQPILRPVRHHATKAPEV